MRTKANTIQLALAFILMPALGVPRQARAQNAPVAPPNIRASAAIVIDGNTGVTLWAKNPDKRLPPASTTKIATGLLLARDVPPDQPITTSAQAARTPGHALGMRAGETFRARDLLRAILLASANDASVAAAEKMACTESAFADGMNAWARQSGASNSHFANASGLPAPGHYSTARDLAAMARIALQNPAFADVVRTRSYLLPRAAPRHATPLTNENILLGTVPGMDGVKAGWTQEAGACFVGSATRGGRRIITVVLNSPDWQRETTVLLDYGFAARPQTPTGQAQTVQAAATSGSAASQTRLSPPKTLPQTHPKIVSAKPDSVKPDGARRGSANLNSIKLDGAKPDIVRSTPGERAQVHARDANIPPQVQPAAGLPSGDATSADTTPVPHTAGADSGVTNASNVSGRVPHIPVKEAAPFAASGNPKGTGAAPAEVPSLLPHLPRPAPDADMGRAGMSSPAAPGAKPAMPPAVPAVPAARADPPQAIPQTRLMLRSPVPAAQITGTSRALRPAPLSATAAPWRMGMLLVPGVFVFWLLGAWKGHWTMPNFLAGLWKKRDKSAAPVASDPSSLMRAPIRPATPAAAPAFTFAAPVLERRYASAWLESVLETPTRLLEAAARRIATGLRDADPRVCADKIPTLLSAPNARLRIAGADLLGAHAPRLAEETLLALLKDERTATDTRSEAIQNLADLSGDRHERLLLHMLLRDGSPAAAHALARLPQLEDASVQAMRLMLEGNGDTRETEGELKRNLRNAHIACTLVAQGHFTRPDAAPHLNALPANHGEPILVTTLRQSHAPQAVECLVDIVLHGHAYPALQSLLETDPRLIRAALAVEGKPLDRAQQTRLAILKWLTLGEGNAAQIQEIANAGNDLARGALQLNRLHHWEPAHVAPDALCAASQIYSLRLGFSSHAPADIALAFRKAATDGEAQSLAALPPELRPLAQAYAHHDVYDAVQALMHTDDALSALLAVLSRDAQHPAYRRELAFWCDKMPRDTRLTLTQSLAADTADTLTPQDEIVTRAAITTRACDPAAPIRNAALRWLHHHPETAEQTEQAEELSADYADQHRSRTE